MRFRNPLETIIAIDTTDAQLQRWWFGLGRLGLAVDYAQALGVVTDIDPREVLSLRRVVESALSVVKTEEPADSPTAAALEINVSQRSLFSALGRVAATELRDPAKAIVHPGLMYSLFGGQITAPYYTEQAANLWVDETQEIANGRPEPFTANPV